MTIQVEFLIRAHDCYTLGCSVGGIADLLVTAQSTTTKLVAGKHFKLMVGYAFDKFGIEGGRKEGVGKGEEGRESERERENLIPPTMQTCLPCV